jgi:hypothetical protein
LFYPIPMCRCLPNVLCSYMSVFKFLLETRLVNIVFQEA